MVEPNVRRRPIIYWPLDRWRYFLAALLTTLLALWTLWAIWPSTGDPSISDPSTGDLSTDNTFIDRSPILLLTPPPTAPERTLPGTSALQPTSPVASAICVEGTVRNVQDQIPLESWQIEAVPLDDGRNPQTERAVRVNSKFNGSFQFPPSLAAGAWRFALQEKDGWRSQGDLLSIDLELQEDTPCYAINFRVQQVVDLQIEVVDQNDTPLADWIIQLEPAPKTPERKPQEFSTNADGRAFISLPSGGWRLTHSAPDKLSFTPLMPPSNSVRLSLEKDETIRLRNRLGKAVPPESTATAIVTSTSVSTSTAESLPTKTSGPKTGLTPYPTWTPVPIVNPPSVDPPSTCLPDKVDWFVPPPHHPPSHPCKPSPIYHLPHGSHGFHGHCRYRHLVHQGEWIYKIARHYGVAPQAIIHANPWLNTHPDQLGVGRYLCIP